jgi:RimJ/RimL family protein N-acetyltransferase
MLIQTPRLTLRRLTLEDAPFIIEQLNEPGFIQYIGDKNVRNLEDARQYLATVFLSYERHGFGLLGVEILAEVSAPIGICGLVRRDSLPGPDLGYAFLARYTGKGYALEAAQAVLHHARLPRVLAITSPDNERSVHLLEKLGFQFEKMMSMGEREEAVRLYCLQV